MPKPERVLTVGSVNPDEFISGRPDHFDGVITNAITKAWKWPGSKSGKYMTFVGLTIKQDDGDEFEENLQAGWLNSCVPSTDRTTPAGGLTLAQYELLGEGDDSFLDEDGANECQGEFVLGGYSKKTDFEQFCGALRDANFKGWSDSITCLVGLHCRFDRMPQSEDRRPKKSGVQTGDSREWTVLVPTEVYPDSKTAKGTAAGSSAKKTAGGTSKAAASAPATSKAAASSETNGAGDINAQIEYAIYEAVVAAGGSMPWNKLGPVILGAFQSKEEKSAGLAFINNKAGLADLSTVNYNPDTGMLTVE